MVTAVDTSVPLDVLLNDPQHAPASMTALRRAAVEGSLILSEIALAELTPALSPVDLPQFISDWNLTFVPSSQPSAILAGEMFRIYLQRGGKRGRVVPDFLLGAHAQLQVDIAVLFPGLVGDDLAAVERQHGHGHVGPGLVEEARRGEGGAQGCRPAAQGVHDGAQGGEGRSGRLAARRRDDAAHGATVEIGSGVITQVFQAIERVLDQAGNRAVVAGAGDDHAIGLSDGGDKARLIGARRRLVRIIDGESRQERSAEQLGSRAERRRFRQGPGQGLLAGRPAAHRAAQPDDERRRVPRHAWAASAVVREGENLILPPLVVSSGFGHRQRPSFQANAFWLTALNITVTPHEAMGPGSSPKAVRGDGDGVFPQSLSKLSAPP